MKATIEVITCKCNKKATQVCLDHKVYLCDAELSDHKCNSTDLETYGKKIRTKKSELLNSLISLSKDSKKNLEKYEKMKETSLGALRDLRASVNKSLDALIESYSGKLSGLMKAEFITRFEELDRQLKDLEVKGRYLEVEQVIEKNKYQIVKTRNKDLVQNFEAFFTSDSLRTDMVEVLKVINVQAVEINKCIQGMAFDNSDRLEEIKANAFMQVANIFVNENKHFIQSPQTMFSSIIDAKNIKMEYTQSDKHLMNDTMLLTNNDFGNLNKKPTTKNRNTELVDTSFISQMQMSGNRNAPFKGGNTLKLEAEFDIVDEEDELMHNELIDEDDIELEDEEEHFTEHAYKQEIQDKYLSSKEKLNRLLDRVLYDMNCPGFFDKNHKSDLNGYVKKFIEVLQTVLQELLVNFNKL